jgi:probable HAF family extracellular repeat protein
VRWSIHRLISLGGRYSAALAINERGQIAGWSQTASGAEHAVLWPSAESRPIDLGTLGGHQSFAVALDNNGQVVGTSDTPHPEWTHAFLWQNGHMTDLDPKKRGDNEALAINAKGQVLVATHDTGFLWSRGQRLHVPFILVGGYQQLNNRGEVIEVDDRVVWQGGQSRKLPRLDGQPVGAYAILGRHPGILPLGFRQDFCGVDQVSTSLLN